MNITVNIDEVTLATLVDETWRQVGEDDWVPARGITLGDVIAMRVVDELKRDAEHWSSLRSRVAAIRDEEIRERVKPIVDKAFADGIPLTNHYGEPTGKSTTLLELVVDAARKYANQTEQYSGRQTPLQKAVQEAVDAGFKGVIADEVKKARDAVTKNLGQQAAQAIEGVVKNALAGR